MSTIPPSLAPGSLFARDFRVVRLLDEGGMGAVYLAEQLSTGTARALKVMHPELVQDPTSRERFQREARVGARIESDHVVQVVAAGVDDATAQPWLAMELLRGETLAAALARRGAIPPAETAEICRQLGHALGLAHAIGLVHRDVKPENVFLAASRRPGVAFTAKLLDFGIAKILQEAHANLTGMHALGSPLWMAPEQGGGGTITPATDVWALGLLVFYMLTGRYYWRTANVAAPDVQTVLREVLAGPTEDASRRAAVFGCEARLPLGFDAWFGRCVAREAAQRFRDAGAAVAALVPLLTARGAGDWMPPTLAQTAAPAHTPTAHAHTPTAHAQPAFGAPPLTPPHGAAAARASAIPPTRQVTAAVASVAWTPHGTPPGMYSQPPAAAPYPPPSGAYPPPPSGMYPPATPSGAARSGTYAPPGTPSFPQTAATRPRRRAWVYAAAALAAGTTLAGVALFVAQDFAEEPADALGQAPAQWHPTVPVQPGPSAMVAPQPAQPMYVPPPVPIPLPEATSPQAMEAPDETSEPTSEEASEEPSEQAPSAAPDTPRPRALTVRSGSGGAIVDNHTTTATAAVRERCVVRRLGVQVRGEHSYNSDLVVRLRGPQGQTATLQSHVRTNPFRRHVTSAFAGTQASGTWTLSVDDTVRADSGHLDGFTLQLHCR